GVPVARRAEPPGEARLGSAPPLRVPGGDVAAQPPTNRRHGPLERAGDVEATGPLPPHPAGCTGLLARNPGTFGGGPGEGVMHRRGGARRVAVRSEGGGDLGHREAGGAVLGGPGDFRVGPWAVGHRWLLFAGPLAPTLCVYDTRRGASITFRNFLHRAGSDRA
ncbi:MAG: hypothetical protein EBU90_31215, partial [Proteobacteria bacterium]|nr:hypothetical protein [Pseudomonadota bacterium]